MPDDLSAHLGLARRMRAIAVAADDAALTDDVLKAARATVESLAPEDLRSLADMHIMFKDDAPFDVMVGFWLRKRLAAERLQGLGAHGR